MCRYTALDSESEERIQHLMGLFLGQSTGDTN